MSGMNGTEQISPVDVMESAGGQPVPAARPLGDFCMERVGDDVVLYDAETMQYHTLNRVAEHIWRACDGIATIEAIAVVSELPVEVVNSTVADLGEVGLLQSSSERWNATLSRRKATKLVAAGLGGAVGLPVIKSITAPDAASAATASQCRGPVHPNANCAPKKCADVGGTCTALDNGSGYCCI